MGASCVGERSTDGIVPHALLASLPQLVTMTRPPWMPLNGGSFVFGEYEPMAFALLFGLLLMVHLDCPFARRLQGQTSFDQNYSITWGRNLVSFLDQGRVVQLSLDKSSGN